MPPTKRRKTDQDCDFWGDSSTDDSGDDKPCTSKEPVDWRPIGLIKRNKCALQQSLLTDVTFSVGAEKTLFPAHKLILSLASPVFEVMFYGSLKEVGEQVEITDIVPTGFQLMLEYIYTDVLKFNDESEAFAAWIAADKYCLQHMKDLCLKYLQECDIGNYNVWIIYEHSLFLNFPSLVENCRSYLEKNMSSAILSPRFWDISSETLKSIFLMPSLFIKEISLLRGIVLWAKEKVKSGSEETVIEILKPFMEYIRFGCLSQSQFVGFIDEYPDVISDSDAIKILKHMTDIQYPLPEWCSTNVNSRKYSEEHPKLPKKFRKVLRGNICLYALKPHSGKKRSADCSADDQDHPDNLLYRNYHNIDNQHISDSDSSHNSSRSSDSSDSLDDPMFNTDSELERVYKTSDSSSSSSDSYYDL